MGGHAKQPQIMCGLRSAQTRTWAAAAAAGACCQEAACAHSPNCALSLPLEEAPGGNRAVRTIEAICKVRTIEAVCREVGGSWYIAHQQLHLLMTDRGMAPGVAFSRQHRSLGVPEHFGGCAHDNRGALQHLAGAGPAAAADTVAKGIAMPQSRVESSACTWSVFQELFCASQCYNTRLAGKSVTVIHILGKSGIRL